MSTRHAHKFERLSDVAIFCGCGLIKRSPDVAGPYPVYVPPICTRPHYPTWTLQRPYWYESPSSVTSGTADTPTIGTVTYMTTAGGNA